MMVRLSGMCVGLICLGAVPTLADDHQGTAREAAIFGASEDAVEREQDLFGAPPSTTPQVKSVRPGLAAPQVDEDSDAALEGRLQARDDTLKLGGRLYWRLFSAIDENRELDEVRTTNAALFYVYGDARPSDRLRAFVKGRFDHLLSGVQDNPFAQTDAINLGNDQRTRARIDQLWLKFDIERTVFLTVGQQPIRWGTGRIWNPTDFVNAQQRDPLAIFDARPGIALAKAHIPIERTGTNLYAIAQFDGMSTVDQTGGVFRIEQTFGPTEATVSVALRKDEPLRLGTDFSGGLGPLELRGELALTHGGDRRRWRGALDLSGAVPTLPIEEDISDDWTPQAVASVEWGIAYGDADTLYLTAEYFFNDAGYASNSIYPWLLAQGAFVPLYLGRHYAGLNLILPSPGTWNDSTFITSALSNLSDGSVITRFDYQLRILTQLSVYFFAAYHTGRIGEFRFELDIPAVDTIPELAQGVQVPAQWLDLGLWLSLAF
ncbi:MAG: hypothetical protein VX589_11935 [Myxococcota bacterium]|nr:hypothetical protein [Myxococcota bacterium]